MHGPFVRFFSLVSVLAAMLARGSSQVTFTGAELVTVDLTDQKIASENSRITFQLKTISPFGLILYSKGTQGDYIIIEIVQGSLRYKVDLGSTPGDKVLSAQEILVGKNLDDNEWHSIDIKRVKNIINITVDGSTRKSSSLPTKRYTRLDLDDFLYVGGLLTNTRVDKSLGMVTKNYVGCLKNFLFNERNILYNVKYNVKNYIAHGYFKYECEDINYSPVTFPNPRSVITIGSFSKQSLTLQLSFRSYVSNGLLFSKISRNGKIYIEIREGRLVIRVEAPTKSPVALTTGVNLNDGSWHSIDCVVNSEEVSLKLDNDKPLEYRTPALKGIVYDAPIVTLGGGDESVLTGFQGCMYQVIIDTTRIKARHLPKANKTDVLERSCSIVNQCWPNPCHNSGVCQQTRQGFECDCTGTLHNGRTCQVPIVLKTCQDYKSQGLAADSYCHVDPDGAGPMPAFEVLCNMTKHDDALTVIPAKNSLKKLKIGEISVFGNHKYYQHIDYGLPDNKIIAVVKSNTHCRQFVRYECKNSTLLNSPRGPSHVRWVNREGSLEDYWGGAPKGSFKCACGVTKTCSDRTKYCNCDKGDNFWREDSGFLTDKDSLPINLLQFDAETASSYFSFGNLECWTETKTKTTATPATHVNFLKACRPVHQKPSTTTKAPTTIEMKLPQTEIILKTNKPRKFYKLSSPASFTKSMSVKKSSNGIGKGNNRKSATNHSSNATKNRDKPHEGVTISMSILAVIVISATIVLVWAIIAVIVIVRRKRQPANDATTQEHETEDATEMCIFFRQSKREIHRPTIELQRDSYIQRDSYDSSPEPLSTLDYSDYTGFRQPVKTHITLDYTRSKKKKNGSSYFC